MLRQPEIAALAGKVLMNFDGVRYRHWSWVIMPNHVHALFTILRGHSLEDILQGWKGGSARHINAGLGTRGTLWQKDYWDRLVRDVDHFSNCARYIRRNPLKAKLRPGEFLLYERSEIAALQF